LSPRADEAEFTVLFEGVDCGERGDFGEGEAKAGKVVALGVIGETSHEHDVVLRGGGEGEGGFEIGCEFVQLAWTGPAGLGEFDFGKGIEVAKIGGASARGLVALQGGNKIFTQSGFVAAFFVKGGDALRADR